MSGDVKTRLIETEQDSSLSPYGATDVKDGDCSSPNKATEQIQQGSLLKNGHPYTSTEIITAIGFGKCQIILCFILALAWFYEASEIYIMPILSTRLYVEWKLSSSLEAALGSASYAGFALSCIIWGLVSDTFGRRTALLLSSSWILLWAVLCCLAPNLGFLILSRILFSLAAGLNCVVHTYYYEFLPPRHRYVGFVTGDGIAISTGSALPILLAYFFLNDESDSWRWYVFYCTVPGFLLIFIAYFFLLESPRYLANTGKTAEAEKVLRKIAQMNNYELPSELNIIVDHEEGRTDVKSSYIEGFKAVIKEEKIIGSIIGVTIIGITSKILIYGLVFLKTELLFMEGQSGDYCDSDKRHKTYLLGKDDYIALLEVQLADFALPFFYFAVLKWNLSTKITSITCLGLCLILLGSLYFCPHVYVALVLVTLARAFSKIYGIVALFALIGLIPTRIRGSLGGLCYFLSYLLLPLSPYLVQVLFKYSAHAVTSVCIGTTTIGFITAFFLRRNLYSN